MENIILKTISYKVDNNIVTELEWQYTYDSPDRKNNMFGKLDKIDPPIDGTNISLEELDVLLPNYIDVEQLKQYSLSDMSGVF